jgi:enoyl-CoA hydratase
MKHIALERDGAVAIINLCTGGVPFLTNPMCAELEAALIDLGKDNSVRAVVLTGSQPGLFVMHYSVAELVSLSDTLRSSGFKPDETRAYEAGAFDKVLQQLEAMSKPTIAAINGDCMGGAFEMSLACDVRLAEDAVYRIGLPEITIAILPGGGGTQRLTKLVGLDRALDHMLRGEPISPRAAYEKGFVTEIVAGPVLPAAITRAKRYAAQDPRAAAYIKRLAHLASKASLEEGLKLERNLFLDLTARDEAHRLMTDYEAGRVRFETAR